MDRTRIALGRGTDLGSGAAGCASSAVRLAAPGRAKTSASAAGGWNVSACASPAAHLVMKGVITKEFASKHRGEPVRRQPAAKPSTEPAPAAK